MRKRSFRLIFALVLVAALFVSAGASALASPSFAFTQNLDSVKYVTPGQQFTLAVSFDSGGWPVTYQWYSLNGPFQNSNYPTFTAQADGDNTVWCVVTCNGYSAESNRCNIVVQNSAYPGVYPTPVPTVPSGLGTPIIVTQPQSASVINGQTATLSVTAQSTGGTLYYQWYCSSSADGSNAVAISGANGPSYAVAATAANKYYFVTVWASDGYNNSSPVYSNVVPVSYNDGQLKITKHPTGETVDVGGSAMFIARADNANSITWRLVSKDTTKTVNAAECSSYFPGMSVTGANSETLTLINIPAELNGWSAECKFIGYSGVLYSRGAIIEVRGATPSPSPSPTPGASAAVTPSGTPFIPGGNSGTPTIDAQPTGAVLSEGQTTTLIVTATAPDGATLKYQWYRNDNNSNANGTAIAGAQDASYIPDTISGSKYYYVGVWSTDGTNTSKVVYSSPAAVTYTAPIATPAPSATPSPQPSSPENDKSFGAMALVPVIIMVVAAIAIGIGAFFLLKNLNIGGKSRRRDDRYYDDFDDFND